MKTIHVEIGGKRYPCRFTFGALSRYEAETGRKAAELRPDDLTGVAVLLWAGVSSACNAEGMEFGMSFMDFADRLDVEEAAGALADAGVFAPGGGEKKSPST